MNWDVNTLTWVPDTGALIASVPSVVIGIVEQGTAGVNAWKVDGSSVTQPTAQTVFQVSALSGTAAGSGNNTLLTPAAGKAVRLNYMCYNPSAGVTAAFRFGAAGSLFLLTTLTVGGSVIAKDFGAFRYLQGGVNEALILNLSSGVSTNWNIFYTEV